MGYFETMALKLKPFSRRRRFYNEPQARVESFLFGTLPSFLQSLWYKWGQKSGFHIPDWLHTHDTRSERSTEPTIIWIGHSTFLIQIAEITLITDPIFGSPSLLFPRILPPGVLLDQLPPIDVVLLSHNHRDHMDARSLYALKARNPLVRIMVAQGDKAWFDRAGFTHVTEHDWWDEQVVERVAQPPVRFTFLPAWHWSQRGLFDKNRSLWGSWMIQAGDSTMYFAGDTAYASHFKAIAEHFPRIDVALLPIGPCEPRDWMRHTHLDAHDAVQAFIDLKAHHFIPMHWGTFGFGNDHMALPIKRLRHAWQEREHELSQAVLHIIKAGKPIHLR